MVRKSYTPEQIINKLREAEILISQGATLAGMLKNTSSLSMENSEMSFLTERSSLL